MTYVQEHEKSTAIQAYEASTGESSSNSGGGSSQKPPDYMEYVDFFKTRLEVTKAYSEGAKGFVQLSSAGLALPLVFTQAILGKRIADQGLHGVDRFGFWMLVLAWGSFLIAILSGSLYQWLAPRRMWDDLHANPEHKARYGHLIQKWPTGRTFDRFDRSTLYFLMILFFCLGAVSFVFYASDAMGLDD
jgi:hypothetical protein